MKTKVTSRAMGNGSFGIYKMTEPRKDGNIITVYFCGGRVPGKDIHTVGSVCAHATRKEANACTNRGN